MMGKRKGEKPEGRAGTPVTKEPAGDPPSGGQLPVAESEAASLPIQTNDPASSEFTYEKLKEDLSPLKFLPPMIASDATPLPLYPQDISPPQSSIVKNTASEEKELGRPSVALPQPSIQPVSPTIAADRNPLTEREMKRISRKTISLESVLSEPSESVWSESPEIVWSDFESPSPATTKNSKQEKIMKNSSPLYELSPVLSANSETETTDSPLAKVLDFSTETSFESPDKLYHSDSALPEPPSQATPRTAVVSGSDGVHADYRKNQIENPFSIIFDCDLGRYDFYESSTEGCSIESSRIESTSDMELPSAREPDPSIIMDKSDSPRQMWRAAGGDDSPAGDDSPSNPLSNQEFKALGLNTSPSSSIGATEWDSSEDEKETMTVDQKDKNGNQDRSQAKRERKKSGKEARKGSKEKALGNNEELTEKENQEVKNLLELAHSH